MTAPTIEQVLAAIKQAHEQRLGERRDIIKSVQLALNAYEKAVEHDVLADFAQRNGVGSVEPPKADAAAFVLYETVERLPELIGGRPTLPDNDAQQEPIPDDDEEDLPDINALPRFPRLSEAAAARPLYLVGGVVVEAKVEWIKSLGIRAEWIGAKDNDVAVGKVVNRVRSQSVCAVVLLNELMGHMQTGPIVQAARTAGVPHMIGRKGGQAQLLTVFKELELRMTGTARAAH